MKKTKKTNNKKHRHPLPSPPVVRERELWQVAVDLYELYPMYQLIENSYLLSRFWAWFTQIELNPKVRIPMPRYLTYRDP